MSKSNPGKRWLNGLLSYIYFNLRGSDRGRRDGNFDRSWFRKLSAAHFIDTRHRIRNILDRLGGKAQKNYTAEWLEQNAARLWETRQLLVDGLNRSQFDDAIVLKIVRYRRTFFPAEAFDIYLRINGFRRFSHLDLPDTYMGASHNP